MSEVYILRGHKIGAPLSRGGNQIPIGNADLVSSSKLGIAFKLPQGIPVTYSIVYINK